MASYMTAKPPVIPVVVDKMVEVGFNAIGSYTVAMLNSSKSGNNTVSGSSLKRHRDGASYRPMTGQTTGSYVTSSGLSGTWRLMVKAATPEAGYYVAGLWMRIA